MIQQMCVYSPGPFLHTHAIQGNLSLLSRSFINEECARGARGARDAPGDRLQVLCYTRRSVPFTQPTSCHTRAYTVRIQFGALTDLHVSLRKIISDTQWKQIQERMEI